MNTTKRIALSGPRPLHGAADIAELNRILNALHDGDRVIYDEVAASLNVKLSVVADVAYRYQSLWMHA